MKTRVVNLRVEPYHIRIDRTTKWGNPFSHLPGTRAEFRVSTRAESIEKHKAWIRNQPHLLACLHELKGKILG